MFLGLVQNDSETDFSEWLGIFLIRLNKIPTQKNLLNFILCKLVKNQSDSIQFISVRFETPIRMNWSWIDLKRIFNPYYSDLGFISCFGLIRIEPKLVGLSQICSDWISIRKFRQGILKNRYLLVTNSSNTHLLILKETINHRK